MKKYMNVYDEWVNEPSLLAELKADLDAIVANEKEIEDRFYQGLSFGTAGMRGLIGAGTNRINIYTIRHVAEGLAQEIIASGEEAAKRGIVIAYDTRHYSYEFAMETAKTIGKYGIRTYVFKESRPTPELSFALRHLKAFAGVMITASHNPAAYNGFKAYGEDGGQLAPEAVAGMISHMNTVENLFEIKVATEEVLLKEGFLTFILDEIDEAYQKCLLTLRENPAVIEEQGKKLSIVFTPIHGAGLIPVVEGLRNFGFSNVQVVEEQAVQDARFPTVAYPNPEEPDALALAIKLGREKGADLLLATDPDADRLGVAVRTNVGEYALLSGNQLGALLLHYVLMEKKRKGMLPENGVIIKTIVTSDFGLAAAAKFGIPSINTLTGFKFIAEKIEEFQKSGDHTFLFGYEESYGYLIGTFVRDKDAVQAALLTAEMAAYYKAQGKSLHEAMIELYDELGYYGDAMESITLQGKDGQEKITRIMAELRQNPLQSIAGIAVIATEDYKAGTRLLADGKIEKLTLPEADVIKFLLEDGSWTCVRPSGTEPKCKFYFGVCKESAEEAESTLAVLVEDMTRLVGIKG